MNLVKPKSTWQRSKYAYTPAKCLFHLLPSLPHPPSPPYLSPLLPTPPSLRTSPLYLPTPPSLPHPPLPSLPLPFPSPSQENLDLFREELKESSQALSDILGDPHPSSTVGLTPQLEDDEIPVLPSAKPSITATTPTSLPVPTSGSKATPVQPHSSSTVTTSHLHFPTPSHPQSVDTLGENGIEYGATPAVGGAGQGTRKRQRRLSSERTMG